MKLSKITRIFGIIFVLVGILGFIPMLTPDGNLLGIFAVDTMHNLIHLVTGLVAMYCSKNGHSKKFFQIFGIVYGLVAVLGMFNPSAPLLGMISHNHADMYLHTLVALASLYLGFCYKTKK